MSSMDADIISKAEILGFLNGQARSPLHSNWMSTSNRHSLFSLLGATTTMCAANRARILSNILGFMT